MAGTDHVADTASALQRWREAERAAAVARRGKLAAQAAAQAAEHAAQAAATTAEAAKAALSASVAAEESATRTAAAAKIVVDETRTDAVDAEAVSAMADIDEVEAHVAYGDAVRRAEQRRNVK